jgi:tetratricopeptide (TPR) repeat protein
MATASKRLTRKDLRQPDWFQVTTDKVIAFYAQNPKKIWLGVGALVLLVLVIWGWQMFKQRQNTVAGQEFGRAMTHYKSQKYPEALSGFEKVQSYRWSRYAPLAYLYQANIYLATKQTDRAVAAGQRFLSATSPNSLYRQIGLVTLGFAEEQKADCKKALQHYAEAANIAAAVREQAILGKARCAEQVGDTKGAIAAYREYLKHNPKAEVTLKIAELEGKNGGQESGK